MYYVRCNTRSSGASAKGTPKQALDYLTNAHDAERAPSYSHAELAYIARLDDGWKTDLEGGRVPLVGLGALWGCTDRATLAREFELACQPFHDRRGSTGYLSYTFTLPKELSLMAEGHPLEARQAMYAALQATLEAAFPGKEYRAVTAIHARNEAGEMHYHAHVLIGKFAWDPERRRTFSLNSRAGGNTGKARVLVLKQTWKESLDAELRARIGLVVTQPAPYARPALTLADGTYVPPLNRESRRLLDKHLCFRLGEPTASGAVRLRNFRWTHMDAAIFELASSQKAGGWSPDSFRELFLNLAGRLKSYEARVATLKRVGYLTNDGKVTDAFTIHYRAHKGDHPELQRLRADLYKLARAERKPSAGPGRGGGGGAGLSSSPSRDGQAGPGAPEEGEKAPARRAPETIVPSLRQGAVASARQPPTEPSTFDGKDVELWLALHRHQRLIKRLERLGVSPEEFKRIQEEARRHQPNPETLRRLRSEIKAQVRLGPIPPDLPRSKNVIRAYCGVYQGQLVSYFVLAKGILTLRPGMHAAVARQIRAHARSEFFWAKEKMLAKAGRRLRPLFWMGRVIMPDDVDRLELALRRCGELASRRHADELYREQRLRAYRNSRDDLLAQLRSEARSKAVGELREGLDVLRIHRPEDHLRLHAWRDREAELVEVLRARTKQPLASGASAELAIAARAARIGHLLAREREAKPTPPPPSSLRFLARDLGLPQTRLDAADVQSPFTPGSLTAIPPKRVERALDIFRQTGFLEDGAAWTLRADAAPRVCELARNELLPYLGRDEEMSR